MATLALRAPDRTRLVATAALLCVPAAVSLWLAVSSEHNHELRVPTGHLLIVSLVSLMAAAVAVLVARAAMKLEQYQVFLISLGFVTMAGFFAVHAIATPGIVLHGPGIYATGALYGEAPAGAAPAEPTYEGTIIGLSAFLSLCVPSVFFALAYTRLPMVLARQRRLRPSYLLLGLLAALALYAAASVAVPELVASVPISRSPLSTGVAILSGFLLWFAAGQQLTIFTRNRLPTHGALVIGFILLAQAQILMVVTPFWRLNWWEYHVLMLLAVSIALGALFVELDRRRGLERFVSAEVVEMVAGGSRLAGEKRVLTILFADLRGSTALADKMPVDAVVEVISAHVNTIARCVLSQGGMVDKYIGDGLMAIFGTRGDASDGAVPAAQAAREIRAAMHDLGRDRSAAGRASLDFGVGINTGEVILGVFGLDQRAEFTALGDTVNTASRIEGLCKDFGVDVVLSEECAARLGDGPFKLRPLGDATVRGKAETIQVYTLE